MSDEVETELLSFGPRDREFREGKLRVRVLGRPWSVRGQATNPFSLRLIPEILRADVVHCHQSYVFFAGVAALLGRATGRKVVATDLGGGGWGFSSYFDTDPWFHGHFHISEYSRRIAGHEHNPRAHVIFGGVNEQKFSPDPAAKKTNGVLFVGRLLPHKGVDRVIEALPDDVPMEVVGRPYDPAYFELLKELAKGKQVTFHLGFNDDELVAAYRRSRCVVLPSLYEDRYGNRTKVPELLGQTLLEGMACGIPAICTDAGAMPEVVVDQVTGYVVPPGDVPAMRKALRLIWEDPARAELMGAVGRKRVLEHFTWNAVARACLDAYGGASLSTRSASGAR
jgi:glycosyltransferase involved in cell wall biosynthesis